MRVECTRRFAQLLGTAAVRQFLDWALQDNARYQDAHGGETHGQLTYRYPPTKPTSPDVLVQFDYDQDLIVVAIDEDAVEIDSPRPEDFDK
jgi:hypothetical protein